MNTQDFFTLVLPTAGVKYLAELRAFDKTENGVTKRIEYFHHMPFDDVLGMVGAARALDDDARTVYFALAGFAEPRQAVDRKTGQPAVTASGKPKMDQRTQALAVAAKALWLDIDCGAEKAAKGLGYADKAEAVRALAAFCKATNTPVPLIVDSGGGLHCYWPFTSDVTAKQWTAIAGLWQSVTRHFKLRSDAARDTDVASVLRPIGTTNRKGGGAAKVKALNKAESVVQWTPMQWVAHITGVVKQHRIPPAKLPSRANTKPGINDELMTSAEYPPAHADKIVEHCNQLLVVYQSKGDVVEPVWRGALGVLKFAENGEHLAHDWSSGHPNYSESETQEKLDRWEVGPTTCAYFKSCNPDGCAGCAHDGKITSPIQLGVKLPEAQTVDVPVEATTDESTPEQLELPEGFVLAHNSIYKYVTDPGGIVHRVKIMSPAMFITNRVGLEGRTTYHCVVRKHDNVVHTFTLPASEVASSRLAEQLGAYEVFIMTGTINHVRDYISGQAELCAKRSPEQRAVAAFGWNDKLTEFYLGDVAYHVDGTESQVTTVSGRGRGISEPAAALSARAGTVDGWTEAVRLMYGRPGMEPMQYVIAGLFGSLLNPLAAGAAYHGCMMAVTSASSGLGKTTAGVFALSAFGDAAKLTVAGKDGATGNALYAVMGVCNCIPLLLDDFSRMEYSFISSLAYAAVNGRTKIRMDRAGGIRGAFSFAMSPLITSNDDIMRLLSSGGATAEAESLRVLEIGLDGRVLPLAPAADRSLAEELLRENYGEAGRAFVRQMVSERDRCTNEINQWVTTIEETSPTLADNRYRFYRGHIARAMVAARLLGRATGLVFDVTALFKWAVAHCEELAHTVAEYNTISWDTAFNDAVNFFGNQTIVTYGWADSRVKTEDVLRPLRGEPVARMIVGGTNTPAQVANTLIISKTAVRDYMQSRSLPYKSIVAQAEAAGIFKAPSVLGMGDDRVAVGRGTLEVTGHTRCFIIDMAKLQPGARLHIVPPQPDNATEAVA